MSESSNAPSALDIKVFVPAKDFEQSLKFYTLLGWQVKWRAEDDSLAELELANCRFLLQNFYVEDWANNFMLHITVDDPQAWHDHVQAVVQAEGFEGVRVQPPKDAGYAVVTHVIDPAGVLLHFARYK